MPLEKLARARREVEEYGKRLAEQRVTEITAPGENAPNEQAFRRGLAHGSDVPLDRKVIGEGQEDKEIGDES